MIGVRPFSMVKNGFGHLSLHVGLGQQLEWPIKATFAVNLYRFRYTQSAHIEFLLHRFGRRIGGQTIPNQFRSCKCHLHKPSREIRQRCERIFSFYGAGTHAMLAVAVVCVLCGALLSREWPSNGHGVYLFGAGWNSCCCACLHCCPRVCAHSSFVGSAQPGHSVSEGLFYYMLRQMN